MAMVSAKNKQGLNKPIPRRRVGDHFVLILKGVFLILLAHWGFACAPAPPPLPVPAPPPVGERPAPRLLARGAAPHLAAPERSPKLARLLEQLALRYDPEMDGAAREADYLAKIKLAYEVLGLVRIKELRDRSLELIRNNGGEISWEYLRRQRWPDGNPVGVTLRVPVWVPQGAKPVPTYAGFAKTWEEIAQRRPRLSGRVFFAATLEDINAKTHYRPAVIEFEINSLHAPLAALWLEYIFREGCYDIDRRVPVLVVRGGEDTYAAAVGGGPVRVQGLNFADEEGADLSCQVVELTYASLADIHHGRHAPASNHRLGCALDVNDFNFKGLVDGTPNAVSASLRHHNRDAMHRLDARNLPLWVYRAAKKVGYRVPQDWNHVYNTRDWPHFDCGTK